MMFKEGEAPSLAQILHDPKYMGSKVALLGILVVPLAMVLTILLWGGFFYLALAGLVTFMVGQFVQSKAMNSQRKRGPT